VQDVMTILASVPKWLGGGELVTQLKNGKRVLDDYEARANGVTGATKAAKEQAEALAIEAERAADAAARQAESYESRVRQLKIESVALAGNTELAREMQLAAEGYTKEQIAALTAMERQNQAMKDRIKAEEEAAKAAEANRKKVLAELQKDIDQFKKEVDQINKEFESEVKSAMQAAKAYYEEQRRMDEKRLADVAKGPGAGMEEGSAAAAKFMADQVNAAIGAAAVPETPTPGEKEIAEKTRELLIAQQAANAAQLQELETQKALLEEFRQNKFSRFR
jgi:colicin import membrane protein